MTPLEGSIKKWEDIVKGSGEDDGTDNCPLCEEYIYKDAVTDSCDGCPVHIKTGYRFCSGTPYSEWDVHHTDAHSRANPPHNKVEGCQTCDDLAQAELDFLKSLRP